jgi:transcriptional regulator with XRE-family HTH domain
MDIGSKLRSLRKLRGMTVEELSRLSGVSRSYITNIENGRKKEISSRVINNLAAALRTNADYFRVREGILPGDSFPNIDPEFTSFLARVESRPFLRLMKRALDYGVSVETMEVVIDAIINVQQRGKNP